MDGRWVVEVAGDDFYAFLLEILSGGLGDISCDAAEGKFAGENGVGQDVVDDGAALLARCAEDN